MGKLKSELSETNEYWIHRHRYNELKYFCMQYPIWKDFYARLAGLKARKEKTAPDSNHYVSDPTADLAEKMIYFSDKMEMVEQAAQKTDDVLGTYVMKGAVYGFSYDTLNARYNVPCSRGMYYEYYRKFFWILDKLRN